MSARCTDPCLSACCLTPLAARAVQPDEIMPDPKLEARARALSAELRCMVCQNESIDESNADLARDLRLLVRERLQAGDSDDADPRLSRSPLRRFHFAEAAVQARNLAALGSALPRASCRRLRHPLGPAAATEFHSGTIPCPKPNARSSTPCSATMTLKSRS